MSHIKVLTSYDIEHLEKQVNKLLLDKKEDEQVELQWRTNIATFDTTKGKQTYVMHSVLLIFTEGTDV